MLMIVATAWRNLWRNVRRTVILLSGVSVGLFGVLFYIGFVNAYFEQMKENAVATLTGHVKVNAPGYQENPSPSKNIPADEDLLAELRKDPLIQGAASRVIGVAMAANPERTEQVTLVGVMADQEASISAVPGGVTQGRWLRDGEDRALVVGEAFLKRYKTKLDRRVVLMAYNSQGDIASEAFKIVGAFKTDTEMFDEQHVYTSLSEAQKFFALGDRVTEHTIVGVNINDAPVVREKVAAKFDPKTYQVQAWTELVPLLTDMMELTKSTLWIFYGVFYLAMGFGIANTFLMVVHERTRELGVMLALGVSKGLIMGMMMIEAVLVAIAGAIVGGGISIAVVAYFAKVGLDFSFAAEGMEMWGGAGIMYPYLTADNLALVMSLTVAIAVVMSLYPAWLASRVHPVEAIRSL